MLGRRIDRRELQRAVPGIQNIMPCTLRNKDSISDTEPMVDIQLVLASTHTHSRLPRLYPNDLICIRMHFHADVATDRNAHKRHLQMAPTPKCCAKTMVPPRCTKDICSKWFRAVIGLTVTFHGRMKFHTIRSFPQLVLHIYAASDGAVNRSESFLSLNYAKTPVYSTVLK